MLRSRPAWRGILLLGLGSLLAGAAAPRIGASVAGLPGDVVALRHSRLDLARPDELRLFARSREQANAVRESGRSLAEAALARMLLLDRRRAIRVERDLPGIRDTLRHGLALAPAQPYAWARLAAVETALGAPQPVIGRLIGLSISTGPHERELAFARLTQVLESGSVPVQLAQAQIRWAWGLSRAATVDVARRTNALDKLRDALRGGNEDLQAAEALIASPGKRRI